MQFLNSKVANKQNWDKKIPCQHHQHSLLNHAQKLILLNILICDMLAVQRGWMQSLRVLLNLVSNDCTSPLLANAKNEIDCCQMLCTKSTNNSTCMCTSHMSRNLVWLSSKVAQLTMLCELASLLTWNLLQLSLKVALSKTSNSPHVLEEDIAC